MDFSFLVLAAAIWKIRVLAPFFRPLCLFRIQPLEYVGALGLSCPWPGLYSFANPIPLAPFFRTAGWNTFRRKTLSTIFALQARQQTYVLWGVIAPIKTIRTPSFHTGISVNLLLDDIPFFIFNDILKFA